MNPMIQGVITIIVGVGGCVGYFYFANLVLDRVIFPARGPQAGRNINRANAVRPWLFLFPAMFALGLYLVYPVFGSFIRSLYNRAGDEFIGFGNYSSLIQDEAFRSAFFQQLPLGSRGACDGDLSGPACGATDRSAALGEHRKIADLHADGDLLCGGIADLAFRLRQ
jgi:hypothetical protein